MDGEINTYLKNKTKRNETKLTDVETQFRVNSLWWIFIFEYTTQEIIIQKFI